jgi:holin-like protein
MATRKLVARFPRLVRRSRTLQIVIIFAFWLAGVAMVRLTDLPIPGGIVGMVIVLVLLASRRISVLTMRRGAEWFLAQMLLFFVPAVLAVLDHRELFGLLGVKILIVIFVGTLAVMAVTAFTVDVFYRWRSGRDSAHPVLE